MSRKWRYTCAGGKRLREAITATGTTDGCRYKREAAAMTALENCLTEIVSKVSEADADEFQMLKDLISGEAELISSQSPLIKEMGFATSAELVDDRLHQFWDLCDEYRVWVAVP